MWMQMVSPRSALVLRELVIGCACNVFLRDIGLLAHSIIYSLLTAF